MKETSFEMREEYDFSNAKRGSIIPQNTKQTRITIYIDDEILDAFRQLANKQQRGYQPMINEALKEYLEKSRMFLHEDMSRRVIREELQAVA
jgi:uncharacterized protein (DUF4415 family)